MAILIFTIAEFKSSYLKERKDVCEFLPLAYVTENLLADRMCCINGQTLNFIQ